MGKITIFFGVLLAAVGLAGFVWLGPGLHPLWFGLALVLCGVLARTRDARTRMISMHLAVTIGLLGFLIPGAMSTVSLVKAHTGTAPILQPARVHEQMVVALICLVFVVLCVRSFIAARRERNAQGKPA